MSLSPTLPPVPWFRLTRSHPPTHPPTLPPPPTPQADPALIPPKSRPDPTEGTALSRNKSCPKQLTDSTNPQLMFPYGQGKHLSPACDRGRAGREDTDYPHKCKVHLRPKALILKQPQTPSWSSQPNVSITITRSWSNNYSVISW